MVDVAAKLAILVVDDEHLGRDRLLTLLSGEPEVEIVGDCANRLEALEAISALQPDVVFLDVEMPDLDGLGVIDALGDGDGPEIVFVTAHSEYMERAFEVHAVDYLRKPYTNDRFTSALSHARRRVEARRCERSKPGSAAPPAYARVLSALASGRADDGRLAVLDRHTATWHIVRRKDIDWIEADGPAQVCLDLGPKSFSWRKTLTTFESELAPFGFMRVHRSRIVNSARVHLVKSLQKGEYAIILHDGTVIDTGRTYREVVEAFLQR
jgi:two-component system, LytTR family, response regulator